MTAINPTMNQGIPFNAQPALQSTRTAKKEDSFIKKNFTAGGLVGDFANVLKLSYFWATSIGVTDPKTLNTTRTIADRGGVIKNYLGVVELPEKVCTVLDKWDGLKKGTQESVERFADSVFGLAKNCLVDGSELLGTRFQILSKETVSFFNPIGGVSSLSAGVTQLRWEVIPNVKDIQKNWNVETNAVAKLGSAMIKAAKNAALAVVGALVLISTFFMAIPKVGVIIPSLLTVYTLSSIASRFFDELALPKPSTI